MLLPPQLLYAEERDPIAYWVARGWAPVSLHIGEKRETLPVLGIEKQVSLLCIIVLKVLFFRIGSQDKKMSLGRSYSRKLSGHF